MHYCSGFGTSCMKSVMLSSCHLTGTCARLSALISSSLHPSWSWISWAHTCDGFRNTGSAVKSSLSISGFSARCEFYGNTRLGFYRWLHCFSVCGILISQKRLRHFSLPWRNVFSAYSCLIPYSSCFITPFTSK